MRAVLVALAPAGLASPVLALGVIERPIEQDEFRDAPRQIALRCAGLFDLISTPGVGLKEFIQAKFLLRLEARNQSSDADESDSIAADVKAYTARPGAKDGQADIEGAILFTSDLESCAAFADLLQRKYR